MPEHENDGFYWEPDADDPLRQGDLLFNVPIAVMPQRPRFVLGAGAEVRTATFDDYPENAPSTEIVVAAHFGVLGMVITPTCHVSEGEKDEDVVAVVPVEALNLVIPDLPIARNVRAGTSTPGSNFARHLRASGHEVMRARASNIRCASRSSAGRSRLSSEHSAARRRAGEALDDR